MRWLAWKDDSFFSKQGTLLKFDKLEHMLGCMILTIVMALLIDAIAGIYVFIAGFLWEMKDGLMDWEKYGWWGGEGFSWKDLIADVVGIILGYILLAGFFLYLLGNVN
jgi:VanZ family protein